MVGLEALKRPLPDRIRGSQQVALQAGCNDWARTKKGRTAKPAPQNGLERILYFSDGKVAGSLFIEPCSPPSGPEAGSLKVGEVKQ